ncbi:MAG: YraN family protein [Pseudomonadota bacterium]
MGRFWSRVVGDSAEQLAHDFLVAKGLVPLRRNFRCRLGEIDLVMADGNMLVIVEVRFRTSRSLTPAHLTVDYRKQRKLIHTAAMLTKDVPKWQHWPMRFDVVGIDTNGDNENRVTWIRDAFRPGETRL